MQQAADAARRHKPVARRRGRLPLLPARFLPCGEKKSFSCCLLYCSLPDSSLFQLVGFQRPSLVYVRGTRPCLLRRHRSLTLKLTSASLRAMPFLSCWLRCDRSRRLGRSSTRQRVQMAFALPPYFQRKVAPVRPRQHLPTRLALDAAGAFTPVTLQNGRDAGTKRFTPRLPRRQAFRTALGADRPQA